MAEQNDKNRRRDLVEENSDLRKRLVQVRDDAWKMLDAHDKLKRELKRRRNLLGPGYRYPMVCSDGRVWGVPSQSARQETIRWFAGNALSGLLARGSDDDSVAIKAAALIAFDLWGELEKTFEAEIGGNDDDDKDA